MSRALTSDYRCLAKIHLSDGTIRRIQNWQYIPLVWRNKTWNYVDFPIPPLAKKIGEDAQSVILTLPNISSGEHGYLPIRDWIESGNTFGAYLSIYIFNVSEIVTEHVFVVQEQEFDEDNGQEAQIKLTLRQPDDRWAQIMTRSLSHNEVGETVRIPFQP